MINELKDLENLVTRMAAKFKNKIAKDEDFIKFKKDILTLLFESENRPKEYVLGFAFNLNKTRVILIEKDRPEWQKGKHSGVGGKIETTDESIGHAMVREFKEETGIVTLVDDWKYFAVMTRDNDILGGASVIHCFSTFLNFQVFNSAMTQESEKVIKTDIFELNNIKLIEKVNYLIPLALEPDLDFVEIKMLK